MKLFHFSDKLTVAEEIRMYEALKFYYENYEVQYINGEYKISQNSIARKLYENLYILGNSKMQRIILSTMYAIKDNYKWVVYNILNKKFMLEEKDFIGIISKGKNGIKEVVDLVCTHIEDSYYIEGEDKIILVLRPVGEEFINFLTLCLRFGNDLIEAIGYPVNIEMPTLDFANKLLRDIQEYQLRQGIYKPAVDYDLVSLSDRMKLFIAAWRRFLIYDYGVITGYRNGILFEPSKCSRLPLGESIIEKFGGLEMPVLLSGVENPMPKHRLISFIELVESLKGGEK